ncbi:MAG: hypothetical protein H7248_05755 [Microbacteriaceae bacterium]|nr:hypothetical protein [Microbacteriaceae bacterium]
MITLTQDSSGFVRMNRHFPNAASIAITFTDGSTAVVSGQRLNAVYDLAQNEFRATNGLDAKGFSRTPAKTVQPKNKIAFVSVTPGKFQS